MKKIMYVMLVVIMALALNGQVQAAGDTASGDYTYKVENGYAVITGYTGSGGDITIPGNLDGYKVKIIGEDAFLQNASIVKVIMPDTITFIDSYAFADCANLEEIKISANLQGINEFVFSCSPKLKEVTFPASFTLAGMGCFNVCPGLRAININKDTQEGFFSIDGVLFFEGMRSGKYELSLVAYPGNRPGVEYVVPDFVNYISTFSDIQNLEKLVIPASVTYIELNAFYKSKKPIDILLKHDAVPEIASQAFNTLAPGTRIICKNEAVRAEAAASIKGDGITAVLVSETGGKLPATGLQVTASQMTVEPGKTAQISWTQTPTLTTDNVTWESSDETGLTVEKYTGKMKAIYRGTYTVTGRDESGHTVDVTVVVPTLVDNVDLHLKSLVNGEWEKHNGAFCVGETYNMGLEFQYNVSNPQGIRDEDYTTSESVFTITSDCTFEGKYENWEFTPYEAGNYHISYLRKDAAGIVIAQGEKTIQVTREASNLIDLSQANGTLKGSSFPHTGKEIRPEVDTVAAKDGTSIAKDFYTVSYRSNIKPGTGYVILTGRDIVTGKLEIPFTIQPATPVPPTPPLPVTATITGTASYTKTYGDQDFTLSLKTNSAQAMQFNSSNTNVAAVSQSGKISIKGAGKATITVRVPKSSTMTSAEKKVTVQVNKASLSKASIRKISDQTYSGKEKKPSVKVVYQGRTLKPGIDYRVTYQNNKKAGTATATIAGSGNYTGSRKVTFQILAAAKPSSFRQDTGRKTTTSSIQINWKKVSGASGYRIYRSASKSGGFKKIGTITKGSTAAYTDKKLKSGTTYYYKVCAYRKISGKNVDGAYSSVLPASTKPEKASLSVKTGSRKAVLAWKPTKGASGYEIYRGTSKNGKYSRIKTLAKGSIRSYANSRLTGNKTYYYKLRSYRIVEGKKLYSEYSSMRAVKIKK